MSKTEGFISYQIIGGKIWKYQAKESKIVRTCRSWQDKDYGKKRELNHHDRKAILK